MIDRSIEKYNQEQAARAAAFRDASGPGAFVGSRSVTAAQDATMTAQATRSLSAARTADASAARLQEGATEGSTRAMQRNARAAGLNRAQMLNLGFQLQDIVIALQMGQNPLQVFLQQGGQIGQIASQAGVGVRGLTRAIVGMIAPLLPVIAILAALGLAFKDIKDEAEENANLKDFVKTLGLTKQELKELEDVTVTWGDTFKGTLDVLAERMGTTTADIEKFFKDAFGSITEFCKFSAAVIYAAFKATAIGLARILVNLPAMVAEGVIAAVNLGIAAVEKLVNVGIAGLNKLIDGTNRLNPFSDIEHITEVSLGRIENKFAGTSASVASGIKDEFFGAYNEAMGLFDDIGDAAGARARKRLQEQANKIKDDRTDKKGPKAKEDKTAENRAHALSMVNMELDKELARMKLLKDERAVQQRMDQIEQSLAQKKIKLNDDERLSIEGKVRAIESYKYVQSELDRIYEETIGPQRDFNATLQASKELLDQNKLSTAQYAQQIEMAKRKLQEATDPLFQFKEQLTSAENVLGKYGIAAQQAAYYESIRQAMLQKGIILSPQYVAGVNAEVDALMRRNNELLRQQQIQSQIEGTVGGIVNPIAQDAIMLQNKQAFYDALNAMADKYNFNEEQRRQALAQLDILYMEKRLQNARTTFSTLAQLSQSGNKKLAAIGKAAAVAQATIDGYVAVQKALASSAPPWNYIQAAAVAAVTGVQVANILSTNVGNFANGGQFMVDGRAGVDRNNVNMNLSRGERVTVETPAQQRANDGGGNGTPIVVRPKIVNQFDAREFLAEMQSDEGDDIIYNAISRNPELIKAMVG